MDIGHADFLPLINKRRAALADIHCCEHFRAFVVKFLVIAVTADDARLVVIFNVKGVPAFAIQLFLPVVVNFFEPCQLEFAANTVHADAVDVHVLEVEHHIKNLIFALFHIFERALRRHHRRFAHGERVVFFQHIVLKFREIFQKMRALAIVLNAGRGG